MVNMQKGTILCDFDIPQNGYPNKTRLELHLLAKKMPGSRELGPTGI